MRAPHPFFLFPLFSPQRDCFPVLAAVLVNATGNGVWPGRWDVVSPPQGPDAACQAVLLKLFGVKTLLYALKLKLRNYKQYLVIYK